VSKQKSSEYLTTLEKGLRVLTCFSREQPQMTLSDVARASDLSPAVARRCLLTLLELGYVGKTGADVVQLDEQSMQARPEAAEAYGIEALNAALNGVEGTTCVHICFGYAALIHERPEGYSFLPQLADAC